jgi:hypothetical protein
MLMDIPVPELNSVVINGRLTISPDLGDVEFKARNIWVQAGQFYIGTEAEPFQHNAKVILQGM